VPTLKKEKIKKKQNSSIRFKVSARLCVSERWTIFFWLDVMHLVNEVRWGKLNQTLKNHLEIIEYYLTRNLRLVDFNQKVCDNYPRYRNVTCDSFRNEYYFRTLLCQVSLVPFYF
jgi:hypothetical protein